MKNNYSKEWETRIRGVQDIIEERYRWVIIEPEKLMSWELVAKASNLSICCGEAFHHCWAYNSCYKSRKFKSSPEIVQIRGIDHYLKRKKETTNVKIQFLRVFLVVFVC